MNNTLKYCVIGMSLLLSWMIGLLIAGSLLLMVTACTYSVNLIHSEGASNDVVDENQTPQTDIDAAIPLLK